MKKMFGIIIILFILFLVGQSLYSFLMGGFTLNYSIVANNKYYTIKETFNRGHQSVKNSDADYSNYYYEINKKGEKDSIFSFKLVGHYRGVKRMIKELRVFEDDNFICVFPIFKDQSNQLDMLCQYQEQQINYANLSHSYPQLDQYVEQLKKEGYNHPAWEETTAVTKTYEKLEIYQDNLLDDQNLIIWHYKGFYNISKDYNHKKDLLKHDVYNNNLGVLYQQYYIVPEYLKNGYFKKIILNNILTHTSLPIETNISIATDSFYQGIVDDKLYLIDKYNYKQYEIDLDRRKIIAIANKDVQGRYYYNGIWEERSIYEMVEKELTFSSEEKIPAIFEQYQAFQIDSVPGATSGYYYLYVQENEEVSVYRCDKQNLNVLTLLFKTPSINSIKYVKDSIYFLSNDMLYMYQDHVGLQPLVKYQEFNFNQNNIYDVYLKTK